MSSFDSRVVGFNEHLGIRVVEWEEGRCVMELPVTDMHLNRSGVVHGGVHATLVDAVASHGGNYAPSQDVRARSVTVSLSLQYIGQARRETLRAVGTRVGGGRRIYFARGEVFAEDGSLVASGELTGRLFS